MSDNSTIEQIAENIANTIQSSQPEGDLHLIPTLLVILLGSLIFYLFQSKTIISSKNPTLPYIKNIGKDNAIFTLNPSYKNIIQKLQIELIPSKEGEKTITLDLDKNHKSKPAKIHNGISYAVRFRTQTNTSIKWSWWSNDHFLVEDPPYELIPNPQQEDLQQMRAELQEARPCNFLLLGKVGIGKSSLVNTFLTAYNGVIHQDATTSNSDSSVTDKIEIHPIVPGRLNVLDFVGLEKGYAFDFIPEIVKGKCENITRANMRTKEFIFGTPGGPTQVDTVIFVIAADSFNDDKEVNRNILEQLQKSQINSLCIVTRVDCIVKEGENIVSDEDFYLDPRVIQVCKEVNKFFKGPILPMKNYRGIQEVKVSINYVALKALKEAIVLSGRPRNNA